MNDHRTAPGVSTGRSNGAPKTTRLIRTAPSAERAVLSARLFSGTAVGTRSCVTLTRTQSPQMTVDHRAVGEGVLRNSGSTNIRRPMSFAQNSHPNERAAAQSSGFHVSWAMLSGRSVASDRLARDRSANKMPSPAEPDSRRSLACASSWTSLNGS